VVYRRDRREDSDVGAGDQDIETKRELAVEPSPAPPPTTVPMEADNLAAPSRPRRQLYDGDACDKTVVRALAWTRGNVKTSYRQVTYQN
jgi:hypothetical protein